MQVFGQFFPKNDIQFFQQFSKCSHIAWLGYYLIPFISLYNSRPLSQSPSRSPKIPMATPILQAQQPQYKTFIIQRYERVKSNTSNSLNVQRTYLIVYIYMTNRSGRDSSSAFLNCNKTGSSGFGSLTPTNSVHGDNLFAIRLLRWI